MAREVIQGCSVMRNGTRACIRRGADLWVTVTMKGIRILLVLLIPAALAGCTGDEPGGVAEDGQVSDVAADSDDAGPVNSGSEAGSADTPIAEVLRDKLVSVQDGSVREHPAPDLAEKDFLLIYFGASWCVYCRNFTPTLVEFYDEMREDFDNFELILAGEDEAEADQDKYMIESGISWPAVAFDKIDDVRDVLWQHRTRTIPGFVLLDRDGGVIETSPPLRRPEFFPRIREIIEEAARTE